MKKQIVNYLLKRGVKPNYKGFNYVVSALEYTTQFDQHIPINTVYNTVAQQFGITWQCVERCIRTLIEASWEHMNPPSDHKPTNAEFIAYHTLRLRLMRRTNL